MRNNVFSEKKKDSKGLAVGFISFTILLIIFSIIYKHINTYPMLVFSLDDDLIVSEGYISFYSESARYIKRSGIKFSGPTGEYKLVCADGKYSTSVKCASLISNCFKNINSKMNHPVRLTYKRIDSWKLFGNSAIAYSISSSEFPEIKLDGSQICLRSNPTL